jgi:hypothetical protein
MIRKIALSLAALALVLSPLAGSAADDAQPMTVHKSTKQGMVSGGRVEQVSATVTAVDAANRLVTLKGKSGDEEVIKVGPDVKNFDQIKAGDKVVVTLSQGVVLYLAAPGTKAPEPSVTVGGESAKPGAKPAAEVAATIKGQVTVTAIDMKTRMVTLTGQEGRKYKVKAGKEIPLEKLKIGDKVNGEYTETVAIAVEPAKAGKKKTKK